MQNQDTTQLLTSSESSVTWQTFVWIALLTVIMLIAWGIWYFIKGRKKKEIL